MSESPRMRRLRSDLRAIRALRAESSFFDFELQDAADPAPELYRVFFHGTGTWRPAGTLDVLLRDQHEVLIRLGANYPRMMPELIWKSPIFHPNISSSGFVCLGGYGTFWAPSLSLDDLCIMLWDMIRYANYDVNSPYNREAALWVKTQQHFRLPLDARPLRDLRATPGQGPGASQPAADVPAAEASGLSVPLPVERPAVQAIPVAQPEIVFLDEVVEAEIVGESDSDVIVIE